jgi:hypothetical protein
MTDARVRSRGDAGRRGCSSVLVPMARVARVAMPVMHVVHVVSMGDGLVSAVGTVLMGFVVWVLLV